MKNPSFHHNQDYIHPNLKIEQVHTSIADLYKAIQEDMSKIDSADKFDALLYDTEDEVIPRMLKNLNIISSAVLSMPIEYSATTVEIAKDAKAFLKGIEIEIRLTSLKEDLMYLQSDEENSPLYERLNNLNMILSAKLEIRNQN